MNSLRVWEVPNQGFSRFSVCWSPCFRTVDGGGFFLVLNQSKFPWGLPETLICPLRFHPCDYLFPQSTHLYDIVLRMKFQYINLEWGTKTFNHCASKWECLFFCAQLSNDGYLAVFSGRVSSQHLHKEARHLCWYPGVESSLLVLSRWKL